MQEYGWLHWDDLWDMAGVIERNPDRRKVRLAACAVVRMAWAMMEDPRSRTAVERAEGFADFRVSKQELKAAWRAAEGAIRDVEKSLTRVEHASPRWSVTIPGPGPLWPGADPARSAAVEAARLGEIVSRVANFEPSLLPGIVHTVGLLLNPRLRYYEKLTAQCDLLRDVFGNPFRPVVFDREWRTSTAVSLARGMYDSQDFSPMPILADALQDAGCEDEQILDHCRGGEPHVRGCWVVDLVLGKGQA